MIFIKKKNTRKEFLHDSVKLCANACLSAAFIGCFNREPLNSSEHSVDRVSNSPLSGFEPSYVKLHNSGELANRGDRLWKLMENCRLCPRKCGARRLRGATGFCRAPGTGLVISAAHAHFGEERPLVGSGGSGTIFFAHCNLRCVFCQNWTISHQGRGDLRKIEDLAAMMLQLQGRGCHNINVVTPTHYSAHILKALDLAAAKGLRIPVVYNTSGWENPEIVQALDGVVDIYLPDFKFWDPDISGRFSEGAVTYPELARESIIEMNRQTGPAITPGDGIMKRGLMIRHLVMPNNTSGSEEIMRWIASALPSDTYVNIMAQYSPAYRAHDFPEIARRVTASEYNEVVKLARRLGLKNLDARGSGWF